jgi:UDP-N-acetylmuramoyl-L-alanyl-D-glutamate--2,6-diaminopimelate ligase
MRLCDLVPEIGPDHPAACIVVSGLSVDSRSVRPGEVFFAVPGTRSDGLSFAGQAVTSGALAVVSASVVPGGSVAGVPVITVGDIRAALSRAAALMYPRQPGTIVAVTGTAGKSSVVDFCRQIWAALGHDAASLGTLGVTRADGVSYGSLTTPDPITLHRTLDALADDGVTHLAMEASSHGLDQRRSDGVRMAAAAFTNLGHDHLDYHPTMEAYFAAKMRLIDTLLPPGSPVVVAMDGDWADRAVRHAEAHGRRVFGVGRMGRDLRIVEMRHVGGSRQLTLEAEGRRYETGFPLVGDFQVSNALVAAGLAIVTGAAARDVIATLPGLKGVPGRLETCGSARGGLAVVDYAHKPEALRHALSALRPWTTGRLICVFGCGGDRDRAKRPLMGQIAAELADIVIITDDNPRSEDPSRIRAAILADAPGAIEIGDRREAIRRAIGMMGPGDVVLVAGKGHEPGQIVGTTVLPFDDRQEVRAALSEIAA